MNEWFLTKRKLPCHCNILHCFIILLCPSTSPLCSLFWLNDLQTITQMSKSLIINRWDECLLNWKAPGGRPMCVWGSVIQRMLYTKITPYLLFQSLHLHLVVVSESAVTIFIHSWDILHHHYYRLHWSAPYNYGHYILERPCLQSFNCSFSIWD